MYGSFGTTTDQAGRYLYTLASDTTGIKLARVPIGKYAQRSAVSIVASHVGLKSLNSLQYRYYDAGQKKYLATQPVKNTNASNIIDFSYVVSYNVQSSRPVAVLMRCLSSTAAISTLTRETSSGPLTSPPTSPSCRRQACWLAFSCPTRRVVLWRDPGRRSNTTNHSTYRRPTRPASNTRPMHTSRHTAGIRTPAMTKLERASC